MLESETAAATTSRRTAPTRRGRPAPKSAPLGPGSLTWKLFGDRRGLLLTPRAGTLQTMHPVISQALIDHSDVFEDPLDRIARSSGPILGVVYDPDPEGTGSWVRDQHRAIRSEPGASAPGERAGGAAGGYRALEPSVFYWAHATFFESIIATQELFGTPMTEPEQHQLYEESVTWYARYGMTMDPVPADLDAFRDYWARMLRDELEATPVALDAVHRKRLARRPQSLVQDVAWSAISPFAALGSGWVLRGTLPEPARERLGASWNVADRVAFAAVATAVRTSWPLIPPPTRMMRRARHAATA